MKESENTLKEILKEKVSEELKNLKESGELIIESFSVFASCMEHKLEEYEKDNKEIREKARQRYEKIIDYSNSKDKKEDRIFWDIVYKEIALMECYEALREVKRRLGIVNEISKI